MVWGGGGGSLEVAASVVTWLQRVNRATLLDPVVTGKPEGLRPTVLIATVPEGMSDVVATLPIAPGAGSVSVRDGGGREVLRVASGESLGYWQLGFSGGGKPVIVAGSSGTNGPEALAAVSGQIAGARWIEAGDVVMGDGRGPVLTVSTRERKLAEVPASVAAVGSLEVVAAGPGSVTGDWRRWRWWSIGALWLALSGTVFFVYKQGRQHAR